METNRQRKGPLKRTSINLFNVNIGTKSLQQSWQQTCSALTNQDRSLAEIQQSNNRKRWEPRPIGPSKALRPKEKFPKSHSRARFFFLVLNFGFLLLN